MASVVFCIFLGLGFGVALGVCSQLAHDTHCRWTCHHRYDNLVSSECESSNDVVLNCACYLTDEVKHVYVRGR